MSHSSTQAKRCCRTDSGPTLPAKAPVTVTYPNPENILKQGQSIIINNLTVCKRSKDLIPIPPHLLKGKT